MKLLYVKLAWRNVMRNKRRTILAGLAVGISLASLIFIDGLLDGMLQSMIRTATDTFLGQGEIHAAGFRETMAVEDVIHHSDAVLRSLATEKRIAAYTPRTLSFAMLSSPNGVASVMLYGVDPRTEPRISIVDKAIRQGQWLAPGDDGKILLGSKTAELLEVGVGDRVVLTTAEAGTGALAQDLFRVGGIFHLGIREFDGGTAFINIHEAQRLLALGSGVHEIALRFHHLQDAGNPRLPFWKKYSQGGNEALGWKELVKQLQSVVEMSDMTTAIVTGLIFAIVAVIIMNTLFMSLYERMFEFGVLRAVGTRPVDMALIIFLEAAALAFISILWGMALGWLIIKVVGVFGINYQGIEFAGVTITDLLYPVFRLRQFTLYPLLIGVFSLIAAIYPAIFAARLLPAKAMQRSM